MYSCSSFPFLGPHGFSFGKSSPSHPCPTPLLQLQELALLALSWSAEFHPFPRGLGRVRSNDTVLTPSGFIMRREDCAEEVRSVFRDAQAYP